MTLAEGNHSCTVIDAIGAADDRGIMKARINVKVDGGGIETYEDEVTMKSSIYVMRSCRAVGWIGGRDRDDLTTLEADVAAWIAKTGGRTTVQIKHLEIKKGPKAGQIWAKPNAIGNGPRPLVKPSAETLSDAKEAMRSAMNLEGGTPESAPVDADDLPFVTCSIGVSLGEIAAVLR